jgi:beta-lactamase class A
MLGRILAQEIDLTHSRALFALAVSLCVWSGRTQCAPTPSPGASPVQDAPGLATTFRNAFAARLETIATGADGVIGYAIIDVTSGERFTRLDTVAFPTASTIKLAMLYELFKRADEGRIALDEVQPLDRAHAVPGGLLYELTTPSISTRDLAVAMILQSDNTATNVLIERLGMASINARCAALGLGATRLRRRMIDLDAARRGDENVSSPADLARLVLAFHNGEGLAPQSKQAALDILKKRKESAIGTGVPEEIAIASKAGELEGVRADAGIVYVPGRPYVFVAMGTFLQETADVNRPLEELARLSYGYFSRRAGPSEYGRQIR